MPSANPWEADWKEPPAVAMDDPTFLALPADQKAAKLSQDAEFMKLSDAAKTSVLRSVTPMPAVAPTTAVVKPDEQLSTLSPKARAIVLAQDEDFRSLSKPAQMEVLRSFPDMASAPLADLSTYYSTATGNPLPPDVFERAAVRMDEATAQASDPLKVGLKGETGGAAYGVTRRGTAEQLAGTIVRSGMGAAGKALQVAGTSLVGRDALHRVGNAVRSIPKVATGAEPTAEDTPMSILRKNFLNMTEDAVKEFIALNIESLTSPAALASLGLGAAASAGVRAGVTKALSGEVVAGAQALVGAAKGATPLGVAGGAAKEIGSLLTGVPTRTPGTLGGAVIGATAERVTEGVAKIADKIIMPAKGTWWTLKVGAPELRALGAARSLDVPLEAASVRTIARELLAPAGSTLTPELQAARFRMLTNTEKGLVEATEFGQRVARSGLNSGERAAAGALVESGGLAPFTSKPGMSIPEIRARESAVHMVDMASPEVRKVAEETAAKMDSLREGMEKAGYPPQIFERLQGEYLGRYYTGEAIPVGGTKAVLGKTDKGPMKITGPEASRMKERGDFTPAEREAMGEITDVGYRAMKTIAHERYLAAYGQFQSEIAKTPGMVSDVAKPGFVKIADESSRSAIPALRGRYVSWDVARELKYFDDAAQEMAHPRFGRAVMSAWKEIVTADNPGVHIGNVLANFMIADMRRLGSPLTAPLFYASTAKALIANGDDVKEAVALGLFSEGMQHRTALRAELAGAIAGAAQDSTSAFTVTMKAVPAIMKGGGFRAMVTKGRTAMQNLYRAEDDIFRFLAYKDGILRGMTKEQAVQSARRMFVDYSLTPTALRRLGTHPLSPTPFVSWQYGITPQIAKAVAENPMAMVRWGHALDAFNAASAIQIGEDAGFVQRYKDLKAQQASNSTERFGSKNGIVLLLPLRSATGEPMVMDITRYNPLGYVLSGRYVSGNPLMTGLIEMATGVKMYGLSPAGKVGQGEVLSEMVRLTGLPANVVQQAAKAGFLYYAQHGGFGKSPLFWQQATMKVFGRAGLAPKTGAVRGVGETLLAGTLPRVTPVNLKEQNLRASQAVEARMGGITQDIQDQVVRMERFRKASKVQ